MTIFFDEPTLVEVEVWKYTNDKETLVKKNYKVTRISGQEEHVYLNDELLEDRLYGIKFNGITIIN